MKIKTLPSEIWSEYQKLQEYLTEHNVYETVKTNENFYDGKQWEGVKTENMPKPVINVLQRVVKYLIATLASNEVAVSITPFSTNRDDIEKMKPIAKEVEKVIEQTKLKEASRIAIRNAAVDGASYMLQLFDANYETGQPLKGRIENTVIDNTNVYFGNPYSNDIQKQPYIIIAMRQYVKQVKMEAEELELDEDIINEIRPDSDSNQVNDNSDCLCTVLLKFYKDKHEIKETKVIQDELGNEIEVEETKTVKTVWFTKSTENVTLIEPTDLGYSRYPISCFGWDPMKNSYLYNSPMTAVIPNQIFINKCYAIAQMYGLQSAFPKIVYDKNKVQIDKFLDGSTHAVAGIDMMGKFLDFIKVPDFSNNILSLLESTIQQTKECMGVNDASLGNVRPDNTSAIIALQEASNIPLELQRQAFYVFWEDTVRNILDIMANDYGTRQVITEVEGQQTLATVNYDLLRSINFEVNVDIGNGAQYSEIAQVNTLDKLFQNQIIDQDVYVDSIPDKYIPNKTKIVENVRQRKQQAEQAMQQQMQTQQLLPDQQMIG
jgi:hypothetical protein